MSERVRLLVNGEEREVVVLKRSRNAVRFALGGREYLVEFPASVPSEAKKSLGKPTSGALPTQRATSDGNLQVIAPIPGVICEIAVSEGDLIEAGALLLRLEAMKMQNGIFSPANGVISRILVSEGTEVGDGEVLLEIRPQQ